MSKGIGAAAIPMTVSGNNSCDPAVIGVGHQGLTPVPGITLLGKKGRCGFARLPCSGEARCPPQGVYRRCFSVALYAFAAAIAGELAKTTSPVFSFRITRSF